MAFHYRETYVAVNLCFAARMLRNLLDRPILIMLGERQGVGILTKSRVLQHCFRVSSSVPTRYS